VRLVGRKRRGPTLHARLRLGSSRAQSTPAQAHRRGRRLRPPPDPARLPTPPSRPKRSRFVQCAESGANRALFEPVKLVTSSGEPPTAPWHKAPEAGSSRSRTLSTFRLLRHPSAVPSRFCRGRMPWPRRELDPQPLVCARQTQIHAHQCQPKTS